MLSLLLTASVLPIALAQIVSLHGNTPDPPSNALIGRTHTQQHHHHQQYTYTPPQPDPSDLLKDVDLLDIVLLASVDGKFHALNRTSGHTLWSMGSHSPASSDSSASSASASASSALGPSTALAPLVRTHHIDHDPETADEATQQEAYIIEPQSGDIYVMTTPSSPLQRFPFTMQELVDMSPFSFSGDADRRIFVGKKETSLLVVELETGKIKATLNSECPWDQFGEFKEESEVDLDELDGSKPPKPPVTEVYIGRTDYHVSIITRPLLNRDTPYTTTRPQIQNLSFSTYGPNRQDNHLQNLYRHTKDNLYVQSMPSGETISFKARSAIVDRDPIRQQQQAPNSHLLWAQTFNQPIVAVFDVLRRNPEHHLGPHPFVLLQPRPKIQDLLPGLSPTTNAGNNNKDSNGKDNANDSKNNNNDSPSTAYVGFVEETGSLFAMSPRRYPLVAFSDKMRYYHNGRLIDAGPVPVVGRPSSGKDEEVEIDDDDDDEPTSVDEITRLRKQRDARAQYQQQQDRLQCHEKIINDRRCLVGVRTLELDAGDGAETRMRRLIDAPVEPSLDYPFSQQYPNQPVFGGDDQPNSGGGGHLTIDPPEPVHGIGNGSGGGGRGGGGAGEVSASGTNAWRFFWEMGGGTIVLGAVLAFWFFFKKRGGWWSSPSTSTTTATNKVVEKSSVGVVEQLDVQPQPQQELKPAPEKLEVEKTLEQSTAAPSSAVNAATQQQQPRVPQVLPDEDKPDSWQIIDAPPLVPVEGTPATPPATPTPAPATPTPGAGAGDETDREDLDGAATEVEDDTTTAAATAAKNATPKKRTRRGKRGAKKPKNAAGGEAVVAAPNGNGNVSGGKGKELKEEVVEETKTPPSSLVLTTSAAAKASVAATPSLVVSDTVLGYGSHGTVVFRGSLQGRAVAVKRLLADFVILASREVSILQESDDHPNVIRYYYQEAHAGFLYIALELCPASLADLVETPDRDAWRDIAVSFDPKRALKQVTNGLRHLHGLKLVHRDIKPQNILVSIKGYGASGGTGGGSAGAGLGGGVRGAQYRMLISDFGLCKKLDVDQTSFLPTAHGAMAAGTVGWRAPEILSGEVKLNELSDDQSLSSRGSTATINGASSIGSTSSNNSASAKGRTRLTKSVDIFALGCLYYYTLTGGGHPFGDRYEREVNIMKNAKNLELLERFGEEGTEAVDLIEKMLDPTPSERPDTTSCLLHPFFWDSSRRLNFLQDASDRFEIMCRDPRDPHLLTLETNAQNVVGNDWHSRLERVFIENLGKFRKYDGKSIQDLLRALRNKKHHYQDLPDNVKRHLGAMPDGYLAYFTRRYPNLFLHVHRVIKETGLAEESMFRSYFELPDS